MFTRFSPNIQGILYAIAGFAFFTAADATAKYLTQSYSVFMIVGVESFFGVLICLGFSRLLGGLKKTFQTEQKKLHLGRGILNTLTTVAAVLSFSQLPMTLVYTLIFVSPFLTAMLAIPVYREKVDPHSWVAIIAGFAGVLTVMRPGLTVFNPWFFVPLLCALCCAGGFLLARRLRREETLLSLALFPAALSAITILPASLFLYEWPDFADLWVFFLGALMFVCGLTFLAMGFQRGKTSLVAPMQYTQILWGAGLGYLLFEDIPDLWTLIGAAIIIGSGVYLLETERSLTKTKAP